MRRLVVILGALLAGCATPTEHGAILGVGSWGQNHVQPTVGLRTTWSNGVETSAAWTPSIWTDDTPDEPGSFIIEADIPLGGK